MNTLLLLLACSPDPVPAPKDLLDRTVAPDDAPAAFCGGGDPSAPVHANIRVVDRNDKPMAKVPLGFRASPEGAWHYIGATGEDGKLYVGSDRPGEVQVMGPFSKPVCATHDFEATRVGDDTDVVHIAPRQTIQILDECQVHVRVLGAEGTPVEGATLRYGWSSADPKQRSGWGRDTLVPTAADGTGTFIAGEGTVVAGAAVDGALRGYSTPFDACDGAVHDIQLSANLLTLDGEVDAVNAGPIGGGMVTVHTVASHYSPLEAMDPRRELEGVDSTAIIGADGQYRITMALGDDAELMAEATAPNYRHELTFFNGRAGQTIRHRFELAPTHAVALRCAGMPNDSCVGITSINCSVRGVRTFLDPEPEVVHAAGVEQLTMACVDGVANEVDAGNRSVMIEPDATVAWLDYRNVRGEIRGKVAQAYDWCDVRASRRFDPTNLTFDYEYRTAKLDADGRYSFPRVSPGVWHVNACTESADVTVTDTIVDVIPEPKR